MIHTITSTKKGIKMPDKQVQFSLQDIWTLSATNFAGWHTISAGIINDVLWFLENEKADYYQFALGHWKNGYPDVDYFLPTKKDVIECLLSYKDGTNYILPKNGEFYERSET